MSPRIKLQCIVLNQVRREKIKTRLRCLQDLVPGCYKVEYMNMNTYKLLCIQLCKKICIDAWLNWCNLHVYIPINRGL